MLYYLYYVMICYFYYYKNIRNNIFILTFLYLRFYTCRNYFNEASAYDLLYISFKFNELYEDAPVVTFPKPRGN